MGSAEAGGQPFAERLSSEHTAGYDLTLQPSTIDTTVKQLIDRYSALAPADREAFLTPFSMDQSFTLLLFAIRMAMLAVREHSTQRIVDGLMALVIEDCRLDWREVLIVCSLLNHSAQLIGADATALFDRAAGMASPTTAEHLRGFVRRDPGLQRVESFGWRASGSGAGFRYERA